MSTSDLCSVEDNNWRRAGPALDTSNGESQNASNLYLVYIDDRSTHSQFSYFLTLAGDLLIIRRPIVSLRILVQWRVCNIYTPDSLARTETGLHFGNRSRG